MNPITHFLVGWVALERTVVARRDKALICLAGVVPDLDGLGLLVDAANRALSRPETNCYQDWHRLIAHGLPAALAFALLAVALARDRGRVALFAFVAVHLHLLCDLLGSRGTTAEDIWPIWYLSPLTMSPVWSWSGQWPLVGWQNMLISIALIGLTCWRAMNHGYSLVSLFSTRADRVFVETLRRWRS